MSPASSAAAWLCLAACWMSVREAEGSCAEPDGSTDGFCSAMSTAMNCCGEICRGCQRGRTCTDGFCSWTKAGAETAGDTTSESPAESDQADDGGTEDDSDSDSAVTGLVITAVVLTVCVFVAAGASYLSWVRRRDSTRSTRTVTPMPTHHKVNIPTPVSNTTLAPHLERAKWDTSIPVSFPDYWLTSGLHGPKEFTQETGDVKRAIQALMDATWKNTWTRDRGKDSKVMKFEVIAVQRNENPAVWAPYCRLRERIAEDVLTSSAPMLQPKTQTEVRGKPECQDFLARANLMEAANEFYLFHGTKPSAAKAICDGDFLVKMAGSNAGTLYGPGLYFAEASSKSDEYAQDDKDGIFAGLYGLLICRVTAGIINYTDEVRPDVTDLVDSIKKDRTHHCILGDREKSRGTYREFIVFDKDQAYPEYVVIYRRVPVDQ